MGGFESAVLPWKASGYFLLKGNYPLINVRISLQQEIPILVDATFTDEKAACLPKIRWKQKGARSCRK